MIAIDTNVLVRFFQHENDPEQSKLAQALIRDHAPVFLNNMVIVEFVWTCRRAFGMDRLAVHARLEAIAESTEFIVADPALFSASVQGYCRIKLDFADWLIGAANLKNGCEATYTFDRGALKCDGFSLVR
jgi:predicted nucleic-acid-binding protein